MSDNNDTVPTKGKGVNFDDLSVALPDVFSETSPENSRLLVGDGDFSFTHVLLQRHLFRHEKVIVTEFHTWEVVIQTYGNETDRRLIDLEELGVTVVFEIPDGR
jgi:hypothetical protein